MATAAATKSKWEQELGRIERNRAWLARKTGISESHLARIAYGERTVSDEHKARIAAALDLDVDELFGDAA